MLAERLGMPHATIIMEVHVEDGALRVKRELEGGWFQWVAMPLPAVLTIQSGINQLRYATLKGIMAAKKKEIRKVAAPASHRVAPADREPLRAAEDQADADDRRHAGRGGQGTREAAAGRRAGDRLAGRLGLRLRPVARGAALSSRRSAAGREPDEGCL